MLVWIFFICLHVGFVCVCFFFCLVFDFFFPEGKYIYVIQLDFNFNSGFTHMIKKVNWFISFLFSIQFNGSEY